MSKYLVVYDAEQCFWSHKEYRCATTCDTFDEFVMSYQLKERAQLEMDSESIQEAIHLLEDGEYWKGSDVTQTTLEDLHFFLITKE